MKKTLFTALILSVILGLVVSPTAHASSLSTTTRATPGLNFNSPYTWIEKQSPRTVSQDGRIAVFSTNFDMLVSEDTSGYPDVFAYDRVTKQTELISRGSDGKPGNNSSHRPSVSPDGRYVAFTSLAKNLLADPTMTACGGIPCTNIFVYDRVTKKHTLANLNTLGQRMSVEERMSFEFGPILSHNGKSVVFTTDHPIEPNDTNNNLDVAVRDLSTGVTRIASTNSNGQVVTSGNNEATISYDGRYVAFTAFSPLVPEDTNETYDVYRRDLQTGELKLVSKTQGSGIANRASNQAVISGNGQFIVYISRATNIVPGDTNENNDVFVYNVQTGATQRVNVTSRGNQAVGETYYPDISFDGRYVTYGSLASNLVPVDSNDALDIFLFDRNAHVTRRINRGSHDGVQANDWSFYSSISGDGKTVVFTSRATNLTSEASVPPMQLYQIHNPVVHIPFYDPYSIFDLYY
jgi:Tol biopolymer transport system component